MKQLHKSRTIMDNTQLSSFFNNIIITYDGKFILFEVNNILYIKVWTKLFPNGRIFRYWLNLPTGFILLDDNNNVWYYSVLLSKPLVNRVWYAYPCHVYCGLKRIHLSCFWCRKRKIFKGKLSNPVRILLYFAPIYLDSHNNFLKNQLVKKLKSITEFIAGI